MLSLWDPRRLGQVALIQTVDFDPTKATAVADVETPADTE